ncbi:MAG: YdcF family protein [Patescibacteria group bacterium]|nr:YdcF family protein [Patescibacteria group bacterium]
MDKAIVILSGGLYKNKNFSWRTTTFDEGDNFGADGSMIRVIAGHYLYKENIDNLIITSGGKGQYKNIPGAPNISEVIKKELISLGVPNQKIIEEKNSNNTWQQLKEIKKIIHNNNIKQTIIISNKYHLPRITAMIKTDSELQKLLKNDIIKLESAEDILLKYSPKQWKTTIEKAYKSKKIKKRIELEKQGVKDINNGVYRLK